MIWALLMADLYDRAKRGDLYDRAAMNQEGQQPPDQYRSQMGGPAMSARFGGRADAEINSGTEIAALNDFAKAFNLSVADVADFITTKLPNTALRVAGSDYQIPTFREGVEALSDPNAATLPDGAVKTGVELAGTALPMAAGAYQVAGRNLAKAPGALAELAGLGTAAPAAPTFNMLERATGQAKRTQALPHLLNNDGAVVTAGYRLDPNAPITAPAVLNNPAGRQAVRHGFDEGFVAMFQAASPTSKNRMTAMLDIVDAYKKNRGTKARTWHVISDSILRRYKAVQRANKQAADQLDSVAERLKGTRRANAMPAVENFAERLKKMGIDYDQEGGRLLYEGSTIEDVKGAQSVLDQVVKRLTRVSPRPGADGFDAFDLHRFKQYLDEQILQGGKKGKGLKGKAKGAVSQLRKEIDQSLDEAYDEYNRVNTQYSETRAALDALQDVAGQKVNFANENAVSLMGKISRRIDSNAVSGDHLDHAIGMLDDASARHAGIEAGDDIHTLVKFASELERIFGTQAGTSLHGEISKVVAREAGNAATGDRVGALRRTAGAVWGKAMGGNEDEAMRAMRELLSQR